MRMALAVLSAAAFLVALAPAEARGGRVKWFSTKAQPAALQNGVRLGAEAPVKNGRSNGLVVLPLPGRVAQVEPAAPEGASAGQPESAAPEVVDLPTGSLVPAAEAPVSASSKAGPWCADGYVVGGGEGICVLTLKPELRGAPAILSLSN
jgi:hypothetical protein